METGTCPGVLFMAKYMVNKLTSCQRTTNVIRHVMTSRDVRTYNYIDDIICIHKRHNADTEFGTLFSLFEFLGVPVNPSKVVCLSRSLTCMGIEVDLEDLFRKDSCKAFWASYYMSTDVFHQHVYL